MEDKELNSLPKIIKAIQNKEINYGWDQKYFFVTDEDGYIYFLKRDDKNSKHQKYLDEEGEQRSQWPENHYDGKILWKQATYEGRGLIITDMFLKALEIDSLG